MTTVLLWHLLSKGYFCVQKREEKENTVTKKEPQKGFFLCSGRLKKINLTMKKVNQVSSKGKEENPRLFLQHMVVEAAGFLPGDELYVDVNEQFSSEILKFPQSSAIIY